MPTAYVLTEEEALGRTYRPVDPAEERLATPTVQEAVAEELRGQSPFDLFMLGMGRRFEKAGSAVKGYVGGLVGSERMQQEAENRERLSGVLDTALEREAPFLGAAGGAAAEMPVPTPYSGARLLGSLLANMGTSVFLDLLDPGKTSGELVEDAAITGVAELGTNALMRSLMPKTFIPPWTKRSPESVELMRNLQDEGYRFTSGQRMNAPHVIHQARKLATRAGGRRAFNKLEERNARVTDRIATRAIGSDAARPSTKVMSNAYQRLQGNFDDLFNKGSFVPDDTLEDSLWDIVENEGGAGPLSRIIKRHPDVQKMAEDMIDTFAMEDMISGRDVNSFRIKIRKLKDGAFKKGERDLAEGYEDLENIVLDWAQRTSEDPEFRSKLFETRKQYANFSTLSKPGVVDVEGNVDTERLARELDKRAGGLYARGAGFSDLDPIRHFQQYDMDLPKSANALIEGTLGDIVGLRTPRLSPHYWLSKAMHTSMLPGAPESLAGSLGRAAGYITARDEVQDAVEQVGLGALGVAGAGLSAVPGLFDQVIGTGTLNEF